MIIAGRVAGGGRAVPGWVRVERDRIVEVSRGVRPRRADVRHDGVIARGLVDLQVNGGGGVEVTGGAAALDRLDALALAHGVTSYLPTIVSTDDETGARAAAEIAERAADPASPVEGLHLEGPFLSREHPGAHDPARLRARVDPAALPPAYASPALRLVTLAPELPGALELIAALRARGMVVSLGHTDCDAATARRALDAGARAVTHVFNAMAPLRHRAPGPAGVALTDRRAHVGVIADGLHVDATVLALVRRAAGGRVVLVTDASAPAGAPPGDYTLAGRPVRREPDGRVTTPDGVLAGSSLTLDEAVRRWVALAGASLPEALLAASERPARLVGLPGLEPGGWADLVLLDENALIQRVMRRGTWVR